MKKYFCLVMVLALIAGLSACNIKVEKPVNVTETSVVNVTDTNGENVTNAEGEVETQIVTVPVTEVVTDKDGETVTQKDGTPVTEAVTELVTKAGKNDGKTTTNWKDRYNNTTSESDANANKEEEKADEEALKTPFNQSASLNSGASSYKPGDYTASLKKLVESKSYTMAVVLDFKGLEGVEMKDATLIAYVDGDKRAYHYTADLSAFADEINEDDVEGMTDVSGFDFSSFFKNLNNLKVNMIIKNGKFYMAFPQLGVYTETPLDESDPMFEDQIETIILVDGTFIESKTVDGMVRESYKVENGIVHYYYKDAKFARMDLESEGKTTTMLKVNSITRGVKNKLVFAGPVGIKIDENMFG
ncbi:MAG: hypothetical protein K5756_07465 [Clostridiales bacterium]|nr:hypothetical protein [Clostridiales bacterium]